MFCSISGNVPEHPVVHKTTGELFEKSLIEKVIKQTSKHPTRDEPLSVDDLLDLKITSAVKPRAAPATSIPGLLNMFHDEWDSLMLETHSLRTSLHSVRQELSHALYQHDAACRVIARLLKERDEARAQLETVRQQVAAELEAQRAAAAAGAEEAEEPAAKRQKQAGITEDVIAVLADVNASLSKARKKRQISPSLAAPEEIGALSLQLNQPLHATTQGGITAIEVQPENESMVATAGMDGTVQVFDVSQTRVTASLEGHSKKITGLQYLPGDVLLTSSADKTARIWRSSGDAMRCAAVLSDHSAEVVGVTVHPSNKYFVTASADASWAFYDLDTATCLKQVHDEAGATPYSCCQFHPDGLILATGTATNVVRIWEVRQQKNVAKFEGHTGQVRSLCFSENGYHLATAASDGIKLWDLRKLKNFKEIVPYDSAPCNSVVFDYSGYFLGVGGADARVYGQKQDWAVVAQFPDMPKKGVLSLRFGKDAKSLFVGAADHNLRLFSASATTRAE